MVGADIVATAIELSGFGAGFAVSFRTGTGATTATGAFDAAFVGAAALIVADGVLVTGAGAAAGVLRSTDVRRAVFSLTFISIGGVGDARSSGSAVTTPPVL